jgi:hypothetical protein
MNVNWNNLVEQGWLRSKNGFALGLVLSSRTSQVESVIAPAAREGAVLPVWLSPRAKAALTVRNANAAAPGKVAAPVTVLLASVGLTLAQHGGESLVFAPGEV